MSPTRLLFTFGAGLVLAATSVGPADAQAAASGAAAAPAAPAWSGDLPKHFEGIALTDTQKASIAALQRDHHARMDKLRDSARAAGAPTSGNAALDARIEAVRSAEHTAFRALLDEAGRKRFDENMAKTHGTAHGSHGAGHSTGHGRPPRR